jgi:expansin (peptidoglycan-binding protein)
MMKVFIILISLLAYTNTQSYTGDATEYTAGFTAPDGAKGYACGFRWLATKERTLFAALPGPMWNGSLNCGRCASVTCVDDKCDATAKKTTTIVTIVDKCPGCNTGDLDFSLEAWNKITNNQSPSRLKISWSWVSCDSLQDDSVIRLTVDPGANPWYYLASISNSAYGVKSASLILNSGTTIDLTRRDDNYWYKSVSPQLTFPYKIAFVDHNGNSFTSQLADLTAGKTYELNTSSSATGTTPSSTTSTGTATPSSTTTSSPTTSTSSSSTGSATTTSSTSTPTITNSGSYTGDATEYTAGFTAPDGAKGYNCGFRWLATKERTLFAALPGPMWNGSLNCGRCASVTCVDDKCDTTAKKTTTVVTIVDKCPECQVGDLDFSLEAWNKITNNQSPSRLKISWNWVSCDVLQDDKTIRLTVDPGANPWYYSASISNSAYGVKFASLTLSSGTDIELTRRDDNYWYKSINPPLTFPYKITFVDHAGNTFKAQLDEMTAGKTYELNTTSTLAPTSTTSSTTTSNPTGATVGDTVVPASSSNVDVNTSGNPPAKNQESAYLKVTFLMLFLTLAIML